MTGLKEVLKRAAADLDAVGARWAIIGGLAEIRQSPRSEVPSEELHSSEKVLRTLFVEDLSESKTFYTEVFGLEVIYEDDASAVVKISNLIINLLQASDAATLVEPIPVTAPGGSRALLTIEVDDANAVCAELQAHGVKLLNGPIDQPWGRRTAAFADPAGNTWEGRYRG
jgi:lactoylglutathione lyase